MMRVLAADVGGTKTALCLYEGSGADTLCVAREQQYESKSFSGLVPILGEFLRGESVTCAAFGVAGPVIDGVCKTTNLPWVVDVRELSHICATSYCALLNDLEIAVIGVPYVSPDKVVWLQSAPVDRLACIELVAVGTGLGRAFLIPSLHGGPARAFATESGHASWGPRNTIERRLLAYVASRHDVVAVEHLLSGPGLHLLYDFIVHEGLAPPTAQLEIERAEDPSAVIGRLGVKDLDDACAAAVGLFVDVLGSELGNTALRSIPRGGLYVWGGVARKLRSALEGGELIDAFLDKHRMRELLSTIPLALIDEADLALLGAKHAALAALPHV
ncbi:MAG TPA: glucokinase [Polyangiales bacterium]